MREFILRPAIALILSLSILGCETPTSASLTPETGMLEDLPPKEEGDRALTPFDTMTDIEVELTSLLAEQAKAWNSGSVEDFMGFFWKSPQLRFASGDTVARGWPQILTRYKKRYPNPAVMGQLSYKSIEVIQISKNSAVVHGQWQLERAADRPWGLFTLILRKIEGEWKITSDTTTYGGEK